MGQITQSTASRHKLPAPCTNWPPIQMFQKVIFILNTVLKLVPFFHFIILDHLRMLSAFNNSRIRLRILIEGNLVD